MDLLLGYFVYLVISWISGTILNSFIVTIYLQDWRGHRGVVMCDQITSIMSCINVVLQFILTMDGIFSSFGLYLLLPKEFYVCVIIFIFFLADIGFWQTTWLSIAYFIRLSSVSHPFFVWMKSCFPSSAFPLLLGSVLGSFLINIPFCFTTRVELQECITNSSCQPRLSQVFNPSCILIHVVFGCCLPLSFTLLCIGLSVKSLLGHVWKMRQSSSHSFSPQIQALVQAAGTMALRVVVELAFNLSITGSISTSFILPDTVGKLFWISAVICPTAQSIILIMGSPRLKSRLLGRGEPST